MSEMRLVVAGAAGRMGRMLIAAIGDSLGVTLTGALEYSGSPHIGEDAGLLVGRPANGVALSADSGAASLAGRRAHRFLEPGGDGRARGAGGAGAGSPMSSAPPASRARTSPP